MTFDFVQKLNYFPQNLHSCRLHLILRKYFTFLSVKEAICSKNYKEDNKEIITSFFLSPLFYFSLISFCFNESTLTFENLLL